jgi:putative FmdB family regulatory protein
MPLYEYNCHRCNRTFEVLQKFSDEPLRVHPDCGGEVERLISASALQFKGSGWYVTDYARNGRKSAGNGTSESKDETAKTESNSGSTPAPGKSSKTEKPSKTAS